MLAIPCISQQADNPHFFEKVVLLLSTGAPLKGHKQTERQYSCFLFSISLSTFFLLRLRSSICFSSLIGALQVCVCACVSLRFREGFFFFLVPICLG